MRLARRPRTWDESSAGNGANDEEGRCREDRVVCVCEKPTGRFVAVTALVLTLIGCGLGFDLPGGPTKGPIPAAAHRPDGTIDESLVPDYVSVAGPSEGTVGYVQKRFALGGSDQAVVPVYGEDLRTVVGHLVAGRGFVPLGVDPATAPERPALTPSPP